MLSQYKIKINDSDGILNYSKSSLLHGFLMEGIDTDYAEKLHEYALRPYSQHIERISENEWLWVISTLTKTARENIIDKMENLSEIKLKHNDAVLEVNSKTLNHISYDDLVRKYYFNGCERRYITMDFITSTSFKSDGKYIFYPTVRSIFLNLIKRYDSMSAVTAVYTEQVIDDICDAVQIVGYNLKSTVFDVGGGKVPSFRGQITLKCTGPQNILKLVNMLCAYSEYSGIGTKTALGMGAVKINERKQSNGR